MRCAVLQVSSQTELDDPSRVEMWQQGDLSMNEEANLELRFGLRHHIAVVSALAEWWHVVSGIDGVDGVERAEYCVALKKACFRVGVACPSPG